MTFKEPWIHERDCLNSGGVLPQIHDISELTLLLDTVQVLVSFEIKTVRTVLKFCGIHRLLVSFRAYIITYNSQTFFLPQGKKTLKLFIKIQFKPNKFLVNYVLERHFHSFQINIDKRWQLDFFCFNFRQIPHLDQQAMTEATIFTIRRSRIIGYGKIRPLADYRS